MKDDHEDLKSKTTYQFFSLPKKPTREGCLVYNKYEQIAYRSLLSFFDKLKKAGIDFNKIAFSEGYYRDAEIKVWWDLDQEKSDEFFNQEMAVYRKAYEEYKVRLTKAYEEFKKEECED